MTLALLGSVLEFIKSPPPPSSSGGSMEGQVIANKTIEFTDLSTSVSQQTLHRDDGTDDEELNDGGESAAKNNNAAVDFSKAKSKGRSIF